MNFEDPNFLNALREAMRGLLEEERRRARYVPLRIIEDCKISELPEFIGGTDLENYLDLGRKIDQIFEYK